VVAREKYTDVDGEHDGRLVDVDHAQLRMVPDQDALRSSHLMWGLVPG
jgi:hypothetical protein